MICLGDIILTFIGALTPGLRTGPQESASVASFAFHTERFCLCPYASK